MSLTVLALSGAIIGGALLVVVALAALARRRRYADDIEVGVALILPALVDDADDEDDEDDGDDEEDEEDPPPPPPPPPLPDARLAESGGWAAIGSRRVHADCARYRRDGHHGDICHRCRPFLVGSQRPAGGAT